MIEKPLIDLLPYQVETLHRNHRFEINLKARQTGYSFIYAFRMLFRCVNENKDQLIVSSSLRQSRRVMYFVELFIEYLKLEPKFEGVYNYLKLTTNTTTEKRFFHNDKSIYCLPAVPETVRSFSGDTLLDEFAMYKQDEDVYKSVFPSITRGFNITINSTPLGCSNMFYEIFSKENIYKDYKRYSINIYDAIKQGLNINIDEIKNNIDEEGFRQEYCCEFLDETTSFFPYDLLRKCIDDDFPEIKGRACMGIDIGRTTDKTGIAICSESKDVFYLSELQTLTNKDFDTQKFTIKQLYQDYSISKAMQDKGAIGYQISEELEKELSGYQGVFTNQINFMNDVVTFTKKLMEQGKFKFKENRDLINDFHKVKKVITTNNNTSFKIERDKSGHGDRAIAVMLALYCFKEDNDVNIFFV